MQGKWFSNIRWAFVGEGVGKGAVFLTNILMARALGSSGLGMLAAAQSFAAYLWILGDFGVGFYGAREVAKGGKGRALVVSELLGGRVLSGVGACIVGVVCAFLMFDNHTAYAYAAASFQVVFLALTLDWVLRGVQQFKLLACASVIGGGVLTLGSLCVSGLAVSIESKVLFFIGVWGVAQLSVAVYVFVSVRAYLQERIRICRDGWIAHLRRSKFFALSSGVVTAAQHLPILMLNFLVGNEHTGIFSAPYRLILSVITAVYMLTSAAYPILSENYAKDREAFYRQFQNTRITVLGLTLGIGTLIVMFADSIVGLLYGSGFQASGPVLKGLAVLVPLVSMRAVYGTALLAAGKEKLHFMASTAGLLSWGLIGGPLTELFGLGGAAWACLINEAIVVACMVCVFKKRVVLEKVCV